MGEISRRDAVRVLVAGGAVGGLASVAVAGASTQSSIGKSVESVGGAGLPRVSIGDVPQGGPDARTAWARVSRCVSWDRRVMFTLDDGSAGVVELDPQARMLAAACQAAGRPLAVRVWGHDPSWGGVGKFESAIVAIDLADLVSSTPGVGEFGHTIS